MNQDYTETRLDNGLVIGLQRTPTKTIAGRLRVKYGSLHERPQEGLAHFLEHCIVVGGTRKYSPEEVDKKLQLFINWNASTDFHKTEFPVHMLSEYLEDYLDLFSDIAFYPRLESRIVEEERQRLLREISQGKSSTSFKDNKIFYIAILGNNEHTYSGLRNEELVQNFTLEDLRLLHNKGYFVNNMDLILVGDLPDNIESLIAKYFSDKPTGEVKSLELPILGPLEERTILHVPFKEGYNQDKPEESMARINIGWRVPDGFSDYARDLMVLANILGRDMHSRLMTELSRRRGLGYGINSVYMGGIKKGVGVFEIGTSIPSLRANEAIEVIFDQLELLHREEVSSEEVERVKRTLKGNYVSEQESNQGHVGVIERIIDYGLTPEIELEKMDKVTSKGIFEVANHYAPSRNGNYVLINRDPLKD
ncbi:MAG: pitrilysin family protein [Nanoarchaeota archaeon]